MTALAAAAARNVVDVADGASYPVLASTVIYKGSLVAIDAAGYAIAATDTAGLTVVGVSDDTVTGGAASGDKWVRVRAGRSFLMTASSVAQTDVGHPLYVIDDNTVDETSTNYVLAGICTKYVSATSCWVLVGAAISPLAGVTATAAQLNKLSGLAATAYPVQMAVRSFTETAVAGVYTGSVTIPAGSTILDVLWSNQALWNNTTSATCNCGDTQDTDGFFITMDVKAAPVADVDGAGGFSTAAAQGAGDAGAYSGLHKYSAAGTIVTGVVTTVHAVGDTGRSRMTVIFATPTAVAATKA